MNGIFWYDNVVYIIISRHIRGVQFGRQIVQQLGIGADALGGGTQARGDAGIFPAQQGHHMMPQAVSQVGIGAVGAVLDMADVVFGEKFLHLRPGHIQHGPDEPVRLRRDATQTPQAGAPEQVQEHRLGVVVGGVGGGDGAL